MSVYALILLPMLGGPVSALVSRKCRKASGLLVVALLCACLILSLSLISQNGLELFCPQLCGLGLSFRLTGFQILLSLLASVLWLVSGLGSLEEMEQSPKGWRYHLFLLLTLGAIQGVFLSADLYTTLIFFELMSFTSFVLVMHYEDAPAMKAAGSYLAYAVIGGLVSLMGLFLLQSLLGTLRYDQLAQAATLFSGQRRMLYLAGGLTATTFAAKICLYPLHTWLPMAHPVAPAPASALLSGIITKAGMFGIMALSATLFLHDGAAGQVLLIFAVITMVWGGFQGLCQTNLKATLAYSTMSQIGFILVGVSMSMILGEENGIAVWGSVIHLVNHAWFKLLLFLFAGIVHHSIHALELDEIRGFGRKKPWLLLLFSMPALGVMGIPPWNGYISKTLLHESIVEQIHHLEHLGQSAGLFHAAEWLFLLSGGMTTAYMLKLFVCIFVEKNADPLRQQRYDRTNAHVSPLLKALLTLCALMCPLLGMFPHTVLEAGARLSERFFNSAPMHHVVDYFNSTNLGGGVISVSFGLAFYFLFVRIFVRRREGCYRNPWPAGLSLEERVYRPVLMMGLPFIGAMIARFAASLFEWLVRLCNRLLFFRHRSELTPPEDNHFGRYQKEVEGRRGNLGTLSFGLTLFAVGYMLIMLWLLLSNFLF